MLNCALRFHPARTGGNADGNDNKATAKVPRIRTQSCFPELQKAVGDRYHVQRQVDPTTPDSGEVEIYGLQKAKERACRRFLDNAVNDISNGRCEGPGQCYRRAAELHGLDARLREALHCEGFDEKVWHERGTADKDDCLTMKA